MDNYELVNNNRIFDSNIIYIAIKWLSYLVGVFVTMPIITLKLNGRLFSIFSISYFILIILLSFPFVKSSKKITIGKSGKILFLWFLIALFSSLFGLLYFNGMNEWFHSVINYIPKILSFMLMLVLTSSSKYKNTIVEYFFKGFLLGCVINIVWASIDGMIFYIKGYSINNIIFTDFIKTLPTNRKFITIINSNGIRTGGLNYDPAHLGGIIPIVILHSALNKKKIFIFLSLVALVFSQSNTALVCSVLLLILNIDKFSLVESQINLKKVFRLVLLFSIFIFITFSTINTNNLTEPLKKNIEEFSNRTSEVYINNSDLGIRTLYHLYIPKAALYSGIKVLTGTGFGTAGYAYIFDPYLKVRFNRTSQAPYDPESTYISYLFDTGILGLLIYILILYRSYKYFNKKWKQKSNTIVLASIGSIILSGLFYHFTLTAYQVLIIIMASISIDIQYKKK